MIIQHIAHALKCVHDIFTDQNILPNECEDVIQNLTEILISLKELLYTLRLSPKDYPEFSFLLDSLPAAIFIIDDDIANLVVSINEFRDICQDNSLSHEKVVKDIREELDQLAYNLQPVISLQADR